VIPQHWPSRGDACTFKGCHWWLVFRGGSVLGVRFRSLSGKAIDDVVVRFIAMSRNPDERNVSGVIFKKCEETLPKISCYSQFPSASATYRPGATGYASPH